MEIAGALMKRRMRRRQSGMTLVELLIGLTVLTVGMGGVLVLFLAAINGNNRAKVDTQAVQVSQAVLEALSAVPANTDGSVTLTDCANTAHTITTAAGGSALNTNGDVDWTTGATASYYLDYASCGANGTQATYEVRWQISSPYTDVKLINVSSRLKNAPHDLTRLFAIPATLHTMAGAGS